MKGSHHWFTQQIPCPCVFCTAVISSPSGSFFCSFQHRLSDCPCTSFLNKGFVSSFHQLQLRHASNKFLGENILSYHRNNHGDTKLTLLVRVGSASQRAPGIFKIQIYSVWPSRRMYSSRYFGLRTISPFLRALNRPQFHRWQQSSCYHWSFDKRVDCILYAYMYKQLVVSVIISEYLVRQKEVTRRTSIYQSDLQHTKTQ